MLRVWNAVWRQIWLAIYSFYLLNEPAHEILALFVLRKLILQSRMRSHPVGLDVWFLSDPLSTVYFHTSCMRTAMALARLRGCTGSPEPSLVAYVIRTKISCAGSNFISKHWVLRIKTLQVRWPNALVDFNNLWRSFKSTKWRCWIACGKKVHFLLSL